MHSSDSESIRSLLRLEKMLESQRLDQQQSVEDPKNGNCQVPTSNQSLDYKKNEITF